MKTSAYKQRIVLENQQYLKLKQIGFSAASMNAKGQITSRDVKTLKEVYDHFSHSGEPIELSAPITDDYSHMRIVILGLMPDGVNVKIKLTLKKMEKYLRVLR